MSASLATDCQVTTARITNSNNVEFSGLPDNDPRYIKNKGLPDTDNATYIPNEIMQVLGRGSQPKENLAPSKYRLSTTTGTVKKPASNVWNYKRREKFKHLTDTTMCKCGAGKDISFLYDVPVPHRPATPDDKTDKSAIRKEGEPQHEALQLPKTLIPEEYHMVKNRGVMGLEYHDDDYTTYTQDHEDHLVMFPSMKPSSRYEVMKLRQSMQTMLTKLGIHDDTLEVRGPTQMHNLLELIKKEQNIYNIVFHELIRQCSVDCIERGELLSDLRNKYHSLLSKVPVQIKGLHNEVLAQRALDRRLTEELLRFKATITLLTNELVMVRAHDRKVTLEAEEAQKELKSALEEAAKNASLLQEYHDLYELQRGRLERSVDVLVKEKEMWCSAAYSLAIKVAEESRLGSARKLHVIEKSWTKLSHHFTILLSDKDTELITQIQADVDQFRNMVADFNVALLHREDRMRDSVKLIQQGIDKWLAVDKDRSGSKQFCDAPNLERQNQMLDELRLWQQTLSSLAEQFLGENTMTSEEVLKKIHGLMDSWTDNALKVFNRHRKEGIEIDTNQQFMIEINKDVIELCSQYTIRLTGENGVAKGVIFMLNMLETWETKLNLSIWANNPIPDNHWKALHTMLQEWKKDLTSINDCIGRKVKDSEANDTSRSLDTQVIVKNVQKWATTSMSSIDSENANLIEQVSGLHNDMVHWMIQMLLRLAPNFEGNSLEITQVALLASDTIPNLQIKAFRLFDRLRIFSKYVSLCCNGIVQENVDERQNRNDENADLEMKDLNRLRTDCVEWVHTAKLLLSRLTGEADPQPPACLGESDIPDQFLASLDIKDNSPVNITDIEKNFAVAETKTTIPSPLTQDDKGGSVTPGNEEQGIGGNELEQKASQQICETPGVKEPSIVEEEDEEVDHMEYLGIDENTHKQTVTTEETPTADFAQTVESPNTDRPLTPNTKRAFEALAAMSILQNKLLEAERRAFQVEEELSVAKATISRQEEELRGFKVHPESLSSMENAPSISNLHTVTSHINLSDTYISQKLGDTDTTATDTLKTVIPEISEPTESSTTKKLKVSKSMRKQHSSLMDKVTKPSKSSKTGHASYIN